MAELQAMQKTALNRNIDKAGNIQKAVTLTEENWTGLTGAVELTGQAVLKLQETMEQLPSGEQMDSSELSEVTTSMRHSASRLQWQLYLPTILLVLWELVRHLFLLD